MREQQESCLRGCGAHGFTLIEVLVVVADHRPPGCCSSAVPVQGTRSGQAYLARKQPEADGLRRAHVHNRLPRPTALQHARNEMPRSPGSSGRISEARRTRRTASFTMVCSTEAVVRPACRAMFAPAAA